MFDYNDTLADAFHGPLIERAVADILANARSEARVRAIVAKAIHEARTRGAAELAFGLTPVADVAAQLGITPRRVQQLAATRQVGERYGREILFRSEDIDRLRDRRTGRPRTPRSDPDAR